MKSSIAVENSRIAKQKITATEVQPDHQWFSLDVDSIFPSISICLVKEAFQHISAKYFRSFQMNDIICDLLYLIHSMVKMQFFVYNECIYKQIQGFFMGLSASGLIAEWVMVYVEDTAYTIIDASHITIATDMHYVDDLIFYAHQADRHFIKEACSANHVDIKFNEEKELDNAISFLDIRISRDETGMVTSVYRKPTYSRITLNYQSTSLQN